MQTDTSSAPVDTAARARTVRVSYSMANLVRRALIGLALITALTTASAWLLHASTTEPAQASAARQR